MDGAVKVGPAGQTASSDEGELERDLIAVVEASMARFAVPGLALGLRAGDATRLRGFGVTSVENPLPIDADTIFVAGSLTKPVVATAVMALVGENRLALDTPLVEYLPDLKLADAHVAAAVTMRHLLTHTAGWVGDDFEGTDFGPGDTALADAIAAFHNRPQVLPLGSLWSYNNSGFWLAGRVVEVVTGLTLETAVSDLVLEPLGMMSSFFFERDVITHRLAVGHNPVGAERLEVARPWSVPRAQRAAGGLLTTIRDLMRFGSLQLRGRSPDPALDALATQAAAMQEPQLPAEGSASVGLSWVVRTIAGHRVISHAGDWNGQQGLFTVVPEIDLTICSLANSSQGRRANDEIAAWVLRRYVGAAEREPVAVEGDDAHLNALVGTYTLPDKSIQIARRDRRLQITYRLSRRPGAAQVAFDQAAALTDDTRLLVLDGPFEGITGDFAIGPANQAAWVRLGGRVHPREPGRSPLEP